LYAGNLIDSLLTAVENAEKAAACGPRLSLFITASESSCEVRADAGNSEPEQFAQALRLCPADWNLALLLIIHAQLVRTLEPGYNLPNPVDVHQVGTVRAPEQTGIEARQ
jgi:hypothetical protein